MKPAERPTCLSFKHEAESVNMLGNNAFMEMSFINNTHSDVEWISDRWEQKLTQHQSSSLCQDDVKKQQKQTK